MIVLKNMSYRVLVIEDKQALIKQLREVFASPQVHARTLPHNQGIAFEVRVCSTSDLGEFAAPLNHWDVVIIDRMFGERQTDDVAPDVLHYFQGHDPAPVRIVWTAYPEHESRRRCLRLGAWDYIDKGTVRDRDTFTDVFESTIDGLYCRERIPSRKAIRRDCEDFVHEEFALVKAHGGHFAAFRRNDQGAILHTPVAVATTFPQLYKDLRNLQRGDIDGGFVYTTWIPEVMP